MQTEPDGNKNILVTGGTSGLGLQLVKILLDKGYNVTATGRKKVEIPGSDGKFSFCYVDFADMEQSAAVFRRISSEKKFIAVINNAGILSPPELTRTVDGFEYTFQVNFLSHLLLNEIIIRSTPDLSSLRIIPVTSPVYRIAGFNNYRINSTNEYRAFNAYCSSKLYLAMMNDILYERHNRNMPLCFSFNPGTFSSGIYRMQKSWFRFLYHIAAPFMRSPAKVSAALSEYIIADDVRSGMICDRLKRRGPLPVVAQSDKEQFINTCYSVIDSVIAR
jgi:NAD(P)-dependent dehydrogenase (short-subunit alcohol dehydrogenase family)